MFSPKEQELLLIAFAAAYVRIYGSGTRRHIKNAFKAGATVEDITQVLKLGVVQGMQACTLGVSFWLKNWSATPRVSAQA